MTTATQPLTLESLGLTAPDKATEICMDWTKQKFIMTGPSKSGKTKFWAMNQKTYFVKLESGHNHVKHFGTECRSFAEIMTLKNKIFQATKAGIWPYDTIVFDTGDRLLDFITEDVILLAQEKYKKQEINGIGDIPEGNGWFMLKTKVNLFLKQLEELPCAVVLIFHVTTDQREDQVGKYTIETINVGGKSGKAILAWADHVLHIRATTVGTQAIRKMLTRGTRNIEAGNRAGLPPEIAWTEDDKANFDKFRAFFK